MLPRLNHTLGIYRLLAGVVLTIGLGWQFPTYAQPGFAIAIHGGAGGNPASWSEEYKQQRREGLRQALDHGISLLEKDGHALDVVESVVRMLENDATFNAAKGCVLNEQGKHELDASIMDGSTLRCGAVAGVSRPKNPITLARRVMEQTPHVLLMGEGAEEFGASQGVDFEEPEYFRTERRVQGWQKWKRQQDATTGALEREPQQEAYFGTVGCVVMDRHGNLAAATSTGGLMGKKWGRVGDSPIIGAGNYANNDSCAVSGTGIGEEFMRFTVAADVAARMRYGGQDLEDAADQTIDQLPENCGGIIAVDATGKVVVEFNTVGMSYALATSAGERQIRLSRDE